MKKVFKMGFAVCLLSYSFLGIAQSSQEQVMSMHLTSSAFVAQAAIPKQYTCQGAEISPSLSWSGISPDAKSLVLIVSDPDAPDPKAPKMTWIHWVLYNLPTNSTGLAENVSAAQLPAGTLQGRNSQHQTGYQGPCPPIGEHRYFFKLYALNSVLPDLNEPDADALHAAMSGKIIAQAELMGTYIKH